MVLLISEIKLSYSFVAYSREKDVACMANVRGAVTSPALSTPENIIFEHLLVLSVAVDMYIVVHVPPGARKAAGVSTDPMIKPGSVNLAVLSPQNLTLLIMNKTNPGTTFTITPDADILT